MKSNMDRTIMLLITVVTNFAMYPVIHLLHKKNRPFEAFIGTFTMLTSFMYHCCDSLDTSIWLSEGQWHRLDNIGGIMGFITWSIHLMYLKNELIERRILYFFLGIVLIFQEKAPWDEVLSAIPIILSFLITLFSFLIKREIPPYDQYYIKRGLFYLFIALLCFFRGLNDQTDPFRFFHGCWHAFVGISAYYNWQIFPSKEKSIQLPRRKE